MAAAPVATLPMYDWPEVAWAHDALWKAIAARLNAAGISAPAELDRTRLSDSVWHDPGLVLAQTCGYPFSTRLRGIVRLVGTPMYDVSGCRGARYSSAIVVRAGEPAVRLADLAEPRFAYNSADSLSGYLALRSVVKNAGLPYRRDDWIQTGSHRASVLAVAEGLASVAAIDAVCWSLALRFEREATSKLRVLAMTRLRPGLPYVTAVERNDSDVRAIQAAISETLRDPSTATARRELRITGLGASSEFDYGSLAALAGEFT
jgi:ABC-type phosphate/phosphonate transport system substrate-binding protein